VICAVDEWVEFTRCNPPASSADIHRGMTHSLWDDLSQQIFVFLTDITLADLVERGHSREAARRSGKLADALGLNGHAA